MIDDDDDEREIEEIQEEDGAGAGAYPSTAAASLDGIWAVGSASPPHPAMSRCSATFRSRPARMPSRWKEKDEPHRTARRQADRLLCSTPTKRVAPQGEQCDTLTLNLTLTLRVGSLGGRRRREWEREEVCSTDSGWA
jgi:hypothetical protein